MRKQGLNISQRAHDKGALFYIKEGRQLIKFDSL